MGERETGPGGGGEKTEANLYWSLQEPSGELRCAAASLTRRAGWRRGSWPGCRTASSKSAPPSWGNILQPAEAQCSALPASPPPPPPTGAPPEGSATTSPAPPRHPCRLQRPTPDRGGELAEAWEHPGIVKPPIPPLCKAGANRSLRWG